MDTLYLRNLNEKLSMPALRSAIEEAFAEYGPQAVIAKKGIKKRGQAFIVLRDADAARRACEALNGKELQGKVMDVQLARQRSDAAVERDGADALAKQKAERQAAKARASAVLGTKRAADVEPHARQENLSKRHRRNPPNSILFVEGLPSGASAEDLIAVFGSARGFVDARVFATKSVGFVEFASEFEATEALAIPPVVREVVVRVSYAKK